MIICRAKLCRFFRISTITRHIFTKWTSPLSAVRLNLAIEAYQFGVDM